MSIVNKRRAGDENIGKLIVFAITIVIAIGLVGLVTYFYNQSRETAVISSVLGNTASSSEDIVNAINTGSGTANCAGSNFVITSNPIAGTYSLTGTTSAGTCEVSGIRGIEGDNDSYKIK